jgi:hypothetical protein
MYIILVSCSIFGFIRSQLHKDNIHHTLVTYIKSVPTLYALNPIKYFFSIVGDMEGVFVVPIESTINS